jgi:hypothetical protein
MASIDKRISDLQRRLGRAEAWEIPMYVRVYLKHLENHRREEAGEQPIPLTPEEKHYERETDRDPAWRAYCQELDRRIEEYEFD